MDYGKVVRAEISPLGGFYLVRLFGPSKKVLGEAMVRRKGLELSGQGIPVFMEEQTVPGDYEYTTDVRKHVMRETTNKGNSRHVETYWVTKKAGEIGEGGLERLLGGRV